MSRLLRSQSRGHDIPSTTDNNSESRNSYTLPEIPSHQPLSRIIEPEGTPSGIPTSLRDSTGSTIPLTPIAEAPVAPLRTSRSRQDNGTPSTPRQYRVIRRPLPGGQHTSVRIRRSASSQSITSQDGRLSRQTSEVMTPTLSRTRDAAFSPPLESTARRQRSHEQMGANILNVPVVAAGRATPYQIDAEGGRRRSLSAPQRPLDPHLSENHAQHSLQGAHGSTLTHAATLQGAGMPILAEEMESGGQPMAHTDSHEPFPDMEPEMEGPPATEARPGMFRKASAAATRFFGGGGGGGGGPSGPTHHGNRRKSNSVSSIGSRVRDSIVDHMPKNKNQEELYDSELVDLLDVVDPEVATLSTLTNVQNSLFIPNLGPLLNRKATYNLSRPRGASLLAAEEARPSSRMSAADRLQQPPRVYAPRRTQSEADELDRLAGLEHQETIKLDEINFRPAAHRMNTIDSTMTESRYAVLPHGVRLEGWTAAEKEELNDHVRHLLHSKREAFKRSMRGFGQYVRRPLGFFVTLYAVLITLFGLAWFLFLIGWISVGAKKDYYVNIIDNVLVALFAIMGDGLAPFRAVDTYHMGFIAYYHRLTWKLRKQHDLPRLEDKNDLPKLARSDLQADLDDDIEDLAATGHHTPGTFNPSLDMTRKKEVATDSEERESSTSSSSNDLNNDVLKLNHRDSTISRSGSEKKNKADHVGTKDSRGLPVDPDVQESYRKAHEYTVLNPKQQARLMHHQQKFAKSHTFYKPHETATHHAFPLRLLITVVALLDAHSCLQIALGTCTWSIPYQTRPFALTTVILCCSITVNILAGVFISIGDHRTRKKDVIERMFRQELTGQAIEKLEKRRIKEAERNKDLAQTQNPTSMDQLIDNDKNNKGKRMQTLDEQTEDDEDSLRLFQTDDPNGTSRPGDLVVDADLGGVRQDRDAEMLSRERAEREALNRERRGEMSSGKAWQAASGILR